MWKFKELIIEKGRGESNKRFRLWRGTDIREMEAIAMGDVNKFHIGEVGN